MQWYNYLRIVAAAAFTAASASTVAAGSYATDTWNFSDAEELTVPPSASAVPRWVTVPYEGTLLWDGCELFLEEHQNALSGVSIPGCVGTIAEISGLRNPDRIPAGAMVMVPSPRNTSAEIATQRSERTSLQALAESPLGMAEALRAFNRDVDETNQQLKVAEGRLDEHDERMTSQADRLSDLETQVTTLAETAGANLSEAEVRSIATEVLEGAAIEPGMTEFEVQAQIQAALDEQGAEFEQLASDVEALRQELESLRSSQLSPEVYAQTALEIARDIGVSETQVESVVQTALADLDLVSPADMSAAIDAAMAQVQSQVSTLEAQVSNLRDDLRELRSGTSMSPEAYAQAAVSIARDLGMSEADVDQAVQTALADLDLMAPDDVSAAIDDALDERDYVSQAELDRALQDVASDSGNASPTWVPVVSATALAIGVLTLLLLWLKSRRDERRSQEQSKSLTATQSKADEATKTANAAQEEVGKATTEAGKAKQLAVKAMTTAKVAVDLHLKSDQRLKGDLPSPEELNQLAVDDAIDVTIRKDDGADVVVRFTRVTNLLDDGKGNRSDGFKVAGIRNLKQGVSMHPSNMLRVIANANKNNTLVGVGTPPMAAAA